MSNKTSWRCATGRSSDMSAGMVFFTYSRRIVPAGRQVPAMNSCWPCALASARVTVSIRRPSSRAARLRCLWHSRHDPSGLTGTFRPQVTHWLSVPYFSRQDLQATHIQP